MSKALRDHLKAFEIEMRATIRRALDELPIEREDVMQLYHVEAMLDNFRSELDVDLQDQKRRLAAAECQVTLLQAELERLKCCNR